MSAMVFMIAWLEQLAEMEMVATLANVQVGTEEMEDGLGLDEDALVHGITIYYRCNELYYALLISMLHTS